MYPRGNKAAVCRWGTGGQIKFLADTTLSSTAQSSVDATTDQRFARRRKLRVTWLLAGEAAVQVLAFATRPRARCVFDGSRKCAGNVSNIYLHCMRCVCVRGLWLPIVRRFRCSLLKRIEWEVRKIVVHTVFIGRKKKSAFCSALRSCSRLLKIWLHLGTSS